MHNTVRLYMYSTLKYQRSGMYPRVFLKRIITKLILQKLKTSQYHTCAILCEAPASSRKGISNADDCRLNCKASKTRNETYVTLAACYRTDCAIRKTTVSVCQY